MVAGSAPDRPQIGDMMGETDRGSTAAYNYPRFDDYVADAGDVADEDAFWASPRAGQRAPDFVVLRLATARVSGCQTCGGPDRW